MRTWQNSPQGTTLIASTPRPTASIGPRFSLVLIDKTASAAKYFVYPSIPVPDDFLFASLGCRSLEIFDPMLRNPFFLGEVRNPLGGRYFLDAAEAFQISNGVARQLECVIPSEAVKDV
jgi:hypothetical protein